MHATGARSLVWGSGGSGGRGETPRDVVDEFEALVTVTANRPELRDGVRQMATKAQ